MSSLIIESCFWVLLFIIVAGNILFEKPEEVPIKVQEVGGSLILLSLIAIIIGGIMIIWGY